MSLVFAILSVLTCLWAWPVTIKALRQPPKTVEDQIEDWYSSDLALKAVGLHTLSLVFAIIAIWIHVPG